MLRYRETVGLSGDSAIVYDYTSSIGHDNEIYTYVVYILIAHTLHLYRRGIIPRRAACLTLRVLLEALEKKPGELLGPGYEDVFEALEDWLAQKTGGESAYIWIGRSRNDHVSAALRLYTINKIIDTLYWLLQARLRLIELAEKHRGAPVLFHTHQQPSQLATLDCLLLAWEEALASAYKLLYSVIGLVDRSPLGASAGAGTLAPIDPEELARLTGFSGVLGNSLYATGSRLDVTAAALAATALLVEASRIAENLVLLSTPYVSAVRIPESHVATSSIMPHKRNPVTLEVLRARAARAAGLAAGLLAIQKGLPYGYNLDLQEANPLLYTILRDAAESSRILADLFSSMEFDLERLSKLAESYIAWGAELAELLALRTGMPLREAYREVAMKLRDGKISELFQKLGVTSPSELTSMRHTGCRADLDMAKPRERVEHDMKLLHSIRTSFVNTWENLVKTAREVLDECK
ncbi:lyase family protein [Hyperthermus butylicus]|uniref:Argininosuccinate lyase n=1 Tax=Hyperthermus butylicus (strain DSM 5456 / JCM 9403 / PLM1-5) TaxID=415426 RepID=A2BJL5_HYPBU|nr:lyase family protein [Hyperthermus butylicus]ABM80176.1 Argininosuccinate lyase [Hyperthermus butylicus DSM 5456]